VYFETVPCGEEDFDDVTDTFAWCTLPFSQAGICAWQAFKFNLAC